MLKFEEQKEESERMVDAFIEKKWNKRLQEAEAKGGKVIVKIRRSNFAIEDGWELDSIRKYDIEGKKVKLALVKKIIEGAKEAPTRNMTLIELEELNQESR